MRGVKQKRSVGGGGGYLCNYTNYEAASVIPLGEESVRTAKLRIL